MKIITNISNIVLTIAITIAFLASFGPLFGVVIINYIPENILISKPERTYATLTLIIVMLLVYYLERIKPYDDKSFKSIIKKSSESELSETALLITKICMVFLCYLMVSSEYV